jgi:hypothetical protein
MSDPTIGHVDLDQIEADERREKIRNRIIIAVILLIGIAVAFWVGNIVSHNQDETTRAESKTTQAQVEKFNLAQQIAAACKDPAAESLDSATYARLCKDAATIVREGPQGAQGIPGVQGPQGAQGNAGIQGVQGIPGIPGADGKNGTDGKAGAVGPPGADGKDGAVGPPGPAGADGAAGPAGPAGADGKDGAMGPAGPAGADGEPPFAWVVYGPNDTVVERCERAPDFDPAEPRYTCTRENGPLP